MFPIIRILIIIVGLAVLTVGCVSEHGHRQLRWASAYDYKSKFPIVLKKQEKGIELYISESKKTLSYRDQETIKAFIREVVDAGAEEVIISVPVRRGEEKSGKSIARRILRELRKLGLSVKKIFYRSYYRPEGTAVASIRLSYLSIGAEVESTCNLWQQQITTHTINSANLPHTDWGCVTQSNLAAIVAHPADLLTKRGIKEPSATRRQYIFKRYEKGKSTTSEQQLDMDN